MASQRAKKIIDKKKIRQNELRRSLKAAAFVIDPEKGSFVPLAEKIGISEGALYMSISRGGFSPLLAIALEDAVGREHLTREFLCPAKFGKR
jgi:hypothetical protein